MLIWPAPMVYLSYKASVPIYLLSYNQHTLPFTLNCLLVNFRGCPWRKSTYECEEQGSVLGKTLVLSHACIICLAVLLLDDSHTVLLNVTFKSYYRIALTFLRITEFKSFIVMFLCAFDPSSHPYRVQLRACVKSDLSIQLTLEVYKCLLLSTMCVRVWMDAFVLLGW